MSKVALGRGLGSLIPQKHKSEDISSSEPVLKKNIVGNIDSFVNNIDIGRISKNPVQMRKVFDKEALKELADSIKIHGIIEPIIVSDIGNGSYQLIAGERRLEASKIAGLKKVPAIIRSATKQENLELALVENIQRENLNAIEEAKAYKMLSGEFGLTQEEIARKSGKSRSRVANFLRLLALPLEIQDAISTNKISEGHGRAILALENPEKQRALYKEIIGRNLTVRQAEEMIKTVAVAGHTRKIGKKNSPWAETQEALSDFLSSKVEIKKAGKEIKIIIICHDEDDFNKAADKILGS